MCHSAPNSRPTPPAPRVCRSAGAPAAAATPTHNADLYSAVVDDMSKPEPVAAPLACDTRVKVVGLAKAAQYNGQSGVVKAFDRDAGRYEVVLKSGKELKIKRDNMELVDGAVKGGFLSGKQPKASGATGPEVVRPTGKKEGVLDGMKSLNIDQQKVPEWMKPNEDLLKKVNEDKELASGVNNAKINKAIEEVSKDPQAWLKYQDDPEIKSYFGKMMGLFGKQFEEHEKKKAATAPSTGGAAAAGDPIEEIFTSGAIKTKEAATKKAMVSIAVYPATHFGRIFASSARCALLPAAAVHSRAPPRNERARRQPAGGVELAGGTCGAATSRLQFGFPELWGHMVPLTMLRARADPGDIVVRGGGSQAQGHGRQGCCRHPPPALAEAPGYHRLF